MKIIAAFALLVSTVAAQDASSNYHAWTAKQARDIGKALRVNGRVGGAFDLRVLKTERSYNYKLAATWITPEVVQATARLRELTLRLPTAETDAMVATAFKRDDLTFLVEIDPREGSGVIPLDWVAVLEADGNSVRGVSHPELRDDPAFAGVVERNYDYERFWIRFPKSVNGKPSIPANASTVDLVVRIAHKEGRVTWPNRR